MDPEKVQQLRKFVDLCHSDPSIFKQPSLSFFSSYIKTLGGQIPQKSDNCNGYDQIIESDIEFDGDIVEADDDSPQEMGDSSIDVTQEQCDTAQELKAKAIDAISVGKLAEAVDYLTEAIVTNPTSAIYYANRAYVYVKLRKPNAAIRDANAALQINPDFAKGYKARGMANVLLGRWEEAAKDLHLASKLDYDEEINSALKTAEANVSKVEEHRRKYERLRRESDQRQASSLRKDQHADVKEASMKDIDDLGQGTVLSLHDAEAFENKLKAANKLSMLTILYFTALWCGPCRFMSPQITSLARNHPEVVFLKVDIDELKTMALNWKISSVPSFIFIKNEKEVDRVIGADKVALENKIKNYVGH